VQCTDLIGKPDPSIWVPSLRRNKGIYFHRTKYEAAVPRKGGELVKEQFAEDSGSWVGKIPSANQGHFTIDDVDRCTPDVKRVGNVTAIEYTLLD